MHIYVFKKKYPCINSELHSFDQFKLDPRLLSFMYTIYSKIEEQT